MKPLEGLTILDFSTLLPGPLASLILAEAGAEVLKIERPGRGDEMRGYDPKLNGDSVNFHLLNRGKRSFGIDLKDPRGFDELRPLLEKAAVLIEQFRPGVLERLGLGYEAVRIINPRIIYCSITGWGQSGPKSRIAAHDLNYMAETGLLALSLDANTVPTLPPVLMADIAGGTLPAVINILLALRQREATGDGVHLDVAMADSLFTFAYWALGEGFATEQWPQGRSSLVTGGSPRYQIYRTSDGKFLAAAPLEDRFWHTFCQIVGVPEHLRRPDAPAPVVTAAIGELIARRTASQWKADLAGHDVCCSIVNELRDAVADPHTVARNLFSAGINAGRLVIPALPIPLAPVFRGDSTVQSAPPLDGR